LSRSVVVLASASPRRRELLEGAGVAPLVDTARGAELADATLGLAALVSANARAKAREVAPRHPKSVVLGADTLVWLDGIPLGKPRDHADARRMLRLLSGRVHEVATGVHLLRMEPRQEAGFHEVTRVRFRPLDEACIDEYLEKVNVLDKAGAYALQEHGDLVIEAVEGSRTNVIGLPVERTMAALHRHFGF